MEDRQYFEYVVTCNCRCSMCHQAMDKKSWWASLCLKDRGCPNPRHLRATHHRPGALTRCRPQAEGCSPRGQPTSQDLSHHMGSLAFLLHYVHNLGSPSLSPHPKPHVPHKQTGLDPFNSLPWVLHRQPVPPQQSRQVGCPCRMCIFFPSWPHTYLHYRQLGSCLCVQRAAWSPPLLYTHSDPIPRCFTSPRSRGDKT